MESTQPIVYADGHFVPADEAGISPFNRGLLMGDGIFETLVSYDGKPFAVAQHHSRLSRAADIFGLEVPSMGEVANLMQELVEKNELSYARIRLTITKLEEGQSIIITAGTVPEFPAAYSVLTVPFCRNERGALTSLKTTSYGENVIALKYALERGAGEAVFGNTVGDLCEGTATNLFVIQDGIVITPPLSSGCLSGVTRGIAINLCQENGIECREDNISLSDFEKADEAFLTSTLREIRPIDMINGREIDVPEDGIALRLRKAFQEKRGNV